MVQHVPKKLQTDEGLQSLFETLRVPYPTTAVHIGRRVGNLPELIEYHNQAVCELESFLVMYLKDGQIGKNRPTIRKGGFMGIGGKKLDAIDYWTYVFPGFASVPCRRLKRPWLAVHTLNQPKKLLRKHALRLISGKRRTMVLGTMTIPWHS